MGHTGMVRVLRKMLLVAVAEEGRCDVGGGICVGRL